VTPGQGAYEAMCDTSPFPGSPAWRDLTPEQHARFDAVAGAATAALVAAARRPLAPEGLAPLLYVAYLSGLHGAALRSDRARASAIASSPGFGALGREYQAAWVAVAADALKPTVADLKQAAELIRAQDAEHRYLATLEAIATSDGTCGEKARKALGPWPGPEDGGTP
jgi:hypothetical protein